ncbi:hypothetical protein IFM89_025123 [Coptis chinensis]|uniref:Uncharacterized protein n=1 Tax=Coptis chinensis TaxID=261450 RepID=A0A835IYA2_9MAGN|nr:hypothetical protein IFM89_025123 [Coptis chinensis]
MSLPPTPNRFRALEEADTLLKGNWADQVDEWHAGQLKEGIQAPVTEPLIKPPTLLPPLLSRHGFSTNFLHNDTPQRTQAEVEKLEFEIFGSQAQHIKLLKEELEQILKAQESDPLDPTLHQMEFDKATEIEEAVKISTAMAKEKSRVSDALEGEQNSAYFYAIIKMRLARAQLTTIKNREGTILKR